MCGTKQENPAGKFCSGCGRPLKTEPSFGDKLNNAVDDVRINKNKVVAGVLGILFGSLGIHKFYLGRIGLGIVYILFCWTLIPGVLGIIEGIIYLCTSNEEFTRRYVKK